MTNARMRRTAQISTTMLLALGAGLAAGCDWSLAVKSGSLDIVKELICPECDDAPQHPDVEGGGGASSGSDSPSDNDDGGDVDPPEDGSVNGGGERAAAIVAGRRWNVESMDAVVSTDYEGRAVVAVSTKVSVAGVEGESTIFVPSQMWPTDENADPALFEVGDTRVAARQNPSMTIGGKEYLLEFVSSTARVDQTPAGPRVRGVVEAHAVSLAQAGRPDAKKQLLRVSFDADEE